MSSVNYVFYPSKHLFSFSNTRVALHIVSFIKQHKINLIHFDTSSGRFIPVLPFVFRIKKIATVHDPLPHKGEESFKKTVIKYIYSYLIRNYVFYSKFSQKQFKENSRNPYYKTYTAILKPYSYISQIKTTIQKGNKYILYFGRISHYKGIDLLMDAFPSILSKYPNIELVIAGKGNDEFYSNRYLTPGFSNITFLNKYISVLELSNLITNAEFIVCPYREATQSGVLMTAFALNKPVLATNVGAFSEYIVNNENGILVEPNVIGIKNGLTLMLDNNHYKKLEKKIITLRDMNSIDNTTVFSQLYVA
jgi:glycosyltransferase involved in cell wall biosynthesis